MGSSENPIRLLNFVYFNLYQQPLLNRTFPTLISDLFWDALTRYIRRSTWFYIRLYQIRCTSLPYARNKGRPPEHSCKRLPASGSFSVCSLRFMLRLPRLIDPWVVPTSRAVWPFTSELSYCPLPFSMSDISTWPKRINYQDGTLTR